MKPKNRMGHQANEQQTSLTERKASNSRTRSRLVGWLAVFSSIAAPGIFANDDSLEAKRKDIRLVARTDSEAESTVRRFAVVVGVSRYKSDSFSRLEYSEKDARDVAQSLRDAGWSHVSLMTPDHSDLLLRPETRLEIEGRLTEFADEATEKDVLLFYYSGHGFVDSEKQGYVCPSHIDPSTPETLAATAVSLRRIRELMLASKSTKQLLILDACRNDPTKKSAFARTGYTEQELEAAVGLGVLYATAPGKYSFEPRANERDERGNPMNNGLFTHFLLRGLSGEARYNEDEFVTFHELACFVAERMNQFTLQDDKSEYRQQKPFLDWVGGVNDDVIVRRLDPNRAPAVAREPDTERPEKPSPTKPEKPTPTKIDETDTAASSQTVALPKGVEAAIQLVKSGASAKEIETKALTTLESASKSKDPRVALTACAFLAWAYDRMQENKSADERYSWAGQRAWRALRNLNQNFESSRMAIDVEYESVSMRAMSLYYEAALNFVAWEVSTPTLGKKQYGQRSEQAKTALEAQQFTECKDFEGRKFIDQLKTRCPRLFPK